VAATHSDFVLTFALELVGNTLYYTRRTVGTHGAMVIFSRKPWWWWECQETTQTTTTVPWRGAE
jgi:hypothetical protein